MHPAPEEGAWVSDMRRRQALQSRSCQVSWDGKTKIVACEANVAVGKMVGFRDAAWFRGGKLSLAQALYKHTHRHTHTHLLGCLSLKTSSSTKHIIDCTPLPT